MREEGRQEGRAIKEYSDLMFREDEIVPLLQHDCPALSSRERVYLRSGPVTLHRKPQHPEIEKVGMGTLILTERRFTFVPRGKYYRDGEPDSVSSPGGEPPDSCAKSFPFEQIRGRSTEKNIFFQFVLDSDIARFQMHGESCHTWELYYDFVRKKGGYRAEGE
jgi:hypothetical protein